MAGKTINFLRCAPRALALAALCIGVLCSPRALAAPEAHILRIDPRTSQESGDPVITLVVEVLEAKRVSEATAPCAALLGDSQLACMSEQLEKPNALYTPFPFPNQNAILTVSVDGTDRPATFVSETSWGKANREPNVGTAWLILIDADKRMDKTLGDAKEVARRFVEAMGPGDIVNVMYFNERQVVIDSKWLPASQVAKATQFIDQVPDVYPGQGRNRALLNIIKNAATDAFKALGNVGETLSVPMHQAMVVLSNGFAGTDPASTGPGAMQLQQYMSNGRFPEDNTALPKSPVPVISVYFPRRTLDEFAQNAREFMQGMANPQIGGFFTVVRPGEGARAKNIVNVVRTRFSKMHIVKFRVSCIAPTVTQSFKLVFKDVKPPILGDNSFQDVPIGIDPSSWPLDINMKYTQEMAGREGGVFPGGKFRVYGDFCWGGETARAEVYFLPAGQQAPADLGGADVEKAKRTQQQLIAMGMRGKALEATDTFVELEAPDNDKIIHGNGDKAVARLIMYDNKARRISGMTADTILEIKARNAPFPLLLVMGGGFGVTVLALLVVVLFRSGGKGKRPAGAAAPRAPVAAGPSTGSRATLRGSAGTFTVQGGADVPAGRDAARCTIVVNDPGVSSFHATLRLEGGQLLVRDEGSNNGTFLNGAQVTSGAWSPVPGGAELRFGPVAFTVTFE